jgi:hypothetical protein
MITGKQKWLLGLASLASLMVALVVSTPLSTIRRHDVSETRAVNLGPDR